MPDEAFFFFTHPLSPAVGTTMQSSRPRTAKTCMATGPRVHSAGNYLHRYSAAGASAAAQRNNEEKHPRLERKRSAASRRAKNEK